MGLLGSVLTLSPAFKTGLHIVIGAFMLLLGLKMLGWIDFKLPSTGISRLKDKVRLPIKTPFFVGLLNGLMPCGPLQTMQVYAMGTASFVVGALSMLSFALGTSFLMIVMSLLGSILNMRTNKAITKASAVIVIVLSIVTVNRGLALSGIALSMPKFPKLPNVSIEFNVYVGDKAIKAKEQPKVAVQEPIADELEIEPNITYEEQPEIILGEHPENTFDNQGFAPVKDGKQYVDLIVNGYYGGVREKLRAGVPVVMNVIAQGLTGCNNPLMIPKYGIVANLQPGVNTIEFTPTEPGRLVVTCWMGMIRTYLDVVNAS